jgi:hypothetical protein
MATQFRGSDNPPAGTKLFTLKDTADNITNLPKQESDLLEWQTAIELLLACSPTMMARMGLMKVLNTFVRFY